ncbi:MAG: SsrA-binding protein SmpB [Alphaproteobacteria bacterium]|nr:SsrA-binding protein SmpB [Alphaproteobacteria bacterium]
MAKNSDDSRVLVAQNRKARHDYFIEDKLEAGIMLTGSEVKSLRQGKASIGEAFAEADKDGSFHLINAHISEYAPAARFGHQPKRQRKLLLHRRQIDKLTGAVAEKGMTIVPLSMYFNERGICKVELGLARGKKQHDKRATEASRDWDREKQRLLRKG